MIQWATANSARIVRLQMDRLLSSLLCRFYLLRFQITWFLTLTHCICFRCHLSSLKCVQFWQCNIVAQLTGKTRFRIQVITIFSICFQLISSICFLAIPQFESAIWIRLSFPHATFSICLRFAPAPLICSARVLLSLVLFLYYCPLFLRNWLFSFSTLPSFPNSSSGNLFVQPVRNVPFLRFPLDLNGCIKDSAEDFSLEHLLCNGNRSHIFYVFDTDAMRAVPLVAATSFSGVLGVNTIRLQIASDQFFVVDRNCAAFPPLLLDENSTSPVLRGILSLQQTTEHRFGIGAPLFGSNPFFFRGDPVLSVTFTCSNCPEPQDLRLVNLHMQIHLLYLLFSVSSVMR